MDEFESQGERRQAMLAGSPSASRPGGALPKTSDGARTTQSSTAAKPQLPVMPSMYAMRFMAVVFASLSIPPAVQAGPTVYKCITNGAVTYQSGPCQSARPRVYPTLEQLNRERKKKPSQPVEARAPVTQQAPESFVRQDNSPSTMPAERFTCDGRTHCSHMTSCAEATYFLNNCPNVKMDGDLDGIPCERQWCD